MSLVGVDEVGRGALAGPVVVAAVVLPAQLPDALASQLRDSKQLSAGKRQRIAVALEQSGAIIRFAAHAAPFIDSMNIRRATLGAARTAAEKARAAVLGPCEAIMDGSDVLALSYPCRAVVKADATVPAVMAASILAKVMRDELMTALAARWPGYGWEKNAGYGVPLHLSAIRELGLTPHHRRTFCTRIAAGQPLDAAA